MIMQLTCNDCHSETSLLGFVVKEDLKHAKLAHLLETEIKTDDDFKKWLKNKLDNGSAYYKEDKLIVDEEEIFCKFDRWEQNGCKCPECGSTNCEWF